MDHSRIIRGAVGGGRYTVTAPITQWDYGYLFLPEIDDLPATYRLDFSNDEHHGTALSVYCGADGGEVPEELIDTGKDIFVWYFYIGDGYGKTEYKWRIPNKCKPKGDGETPEPSQQSSIDQLIYVANEAIDTAHESASQASASAQSASESAEQAQESARTAGLYSDTAQTYANSAEISANSASASATASANSASQSVQIKDDVEGMVDDAQGYASASAQSATASANSASQASASATSASQSASSAQGYASNAQTSANTASTKAGEASTSAQTASTKASEASQSATTASNKASEASGYATSTSQAKTDAESARDLAQTSASASANSASQASSSATSASQSATRASGYATSAQTSAQTASAKASEASTSAQTASAKASESAQSASLALTYKTDAESSKTASQTAQGLAESARDSAISAQESAEDARDEAQNLVDGISGKVEQIDQNTADIASLEADRYKPYVTDTASGSIASFPDGADNIPLKSLIVNIDPVQSGTGDPSPENICPMSGWTGMQIRHTKKNLLPINIWDNIPYNKAVGNVIAPVPTDNSWTQESDRITYNTTASYTALSLMTPLLPKGTYRFSIHKLSSGPVRYSRYALDKDFTIKFSTYSSNITNISVAITLDEDGYIAVKLDNSNVASQTVEITIQVEVGDTETAYEPYNGTTLPISWQTEAGTVYGGRLDVLSGKLTVTFVESLALDTLNWAYYASGRYFYAVLTKRFANTESGNGIGMWDRYKYFGNNTGTYLQNNMPDMNFGFTTGSANKYIYVKNSRFDNAADFKASLAGSQFICTMSKDNWVEIQLDAHTLNSLYGQNNIFADTGDSTAEYRADTKLYINRLTEPDADMIADANITSGKYFMVGNSLYKATANIASGGQVIVGTNAIRKSLSEALNEINA